MNKKQVIEAESFNKFLNKQINLNEIEKENLRSQLLKYYQNA